MPKDRLLVLTTRIKKIVVWKTTFLSDSGVQMRGERDEGPGHPKGEIINTKLL